MIGFANAAPSCLTLLLRCGADRASDLVAVDRRGRVVGVRAGCWDQVSGSVVLCRDRPWNASLRKRIARKLLLKIERAQPARKSPALMAGQSSSSSSYPSTRLRRISPGTRPTCPILAVPSRPARLFADPLGTDDLAPFFPKPCFRQAERANSAARRRMEQIRRTARAEGMLHSGNTIV